MRFETTAIATLAALASASNIETHEDTPRESYVDPLWHSHDDNHRNHMSYVSNEKQSKDHTKAMLRSSHLRNSVPLTKPMDSIPPENDQNDTFGTPDLGILSKVPAYEDNLEATTNGVIEAGMFERNLEDTGAALSCEEYCAEFERPVVEVSGPYFRELITICEHGGDDCQFDDEIPMNCWNTGKVTDMQEAFLGRWYFNSPLNCWDVSKVTNMHSMFLRAPFFNQDLNEWDVSRVVNMNRMFALAERFNAPLNEWNVAKVRVLVQMFATATKFNQPLSDWDISSVENARWMFYNAYSFNQSLNEWDVSNVLNLRGMFFGATDFNQCLGRWDDEVGVVSKAATIFTKSGCDETGNPVVSGVWCNSDC